MSSPTETDAERIARRYPPSRTPRWLWLAGVALLAILAGVWLVWSALYNANPPVSARVVSFTVTSDQTVDVRLTTQRPDPQRPAVCTLTAQAVTYDTVGQFVLELPPSDQKLEDHDVTIRTFKRATSVKIENCTQR